MNEPRILKSDTNNRAVKRLARLAIFDPDRYLVANPDVAVAGLDPCVHALDYGIPENRRVLSDLAMAHAYGTAHRSRINKPALGFTPSSACATVFVHSFSDEAYRELAASLCADLVGAGFVATQRDEHADHRADHGISLFVAPHEFFAIGRGALWRDPEILGTSFVVLDDPVGSPIFLQSLPAVLEAKGVLDTSSIGAKIWADADIPTFHLEPHTSVRNRWLAACDLGHPLILAAPGDAVRLDSDPLKSETRPLDVLFFDQQTSRRSLTLGRLSETLSQHRCFIYCQQPVHGKAEERLYREAHWRISGHLSNYSRLTLNLMAEALPCFDRRRVVTQAIAGGSVVVSDARFSEPGLEAGTHYHCEDARHLGPLIDWLLLDPEGQASLDRTRQRAFDWAACHNAGSRRLEELRGFLLTMPDEMEHSA